MLISAQGGEPTASRIRRCCGRKTAVIGRPTASKAPKTKRSLAGGHRPAGCGPCICENHTKSRPEPRAEASGLSFRNIYRSCQC